MADLENRIKELTPQQRREVEQFVESLLRKNDEKGDRPIGQSWAGALSDLRDQYTSVELAKKATEWRVAKYSSSTRASGSSDSSDKTEP